MVGLSQMSIYVNLESLVVCMGIVTVLCITQSIKLVRSF